MYFCRAERPRRWVAILTQISGFRSFFALLKDDDCSQIHPPVTLSPFQIHLMVLKSQCFHHSRQGILLICLALYDLCFRIWNSFKNVNGSLNSTYEYQSGYGRHHRSGFCIFWWSCAQIPNTAWLFVIFQAIISDRNKKNPLYSNNYKGNRFQHEISCLSQAFCGKNKIYHHHSHYWSVNQGIKIGFAVLRVNFFLLLSSCCICNFS